MSYNSYKEKLSQLRFLLQHNMAGNTNNLSEKLAVSRRTIHRMLDQLRHEGLNFRYSHHSRTYVMDNEPVINK